ncbi:MAG: hypothetical protein COY70_00590 [Candidatus Magasanikbacteria bacterium CG_4_10_14_0_8_um_filter_42_12]|nr:MAG: hypothetical protein COY70_00590 [Candidatus Magasanikbacteria bacterium CG_4_10_14_0_8_um_filter_42_12]
MSSIKETPSELPWTPDTKSVPPVTPAVEIPGKFPPREEPDYTPKGTTSTHDGDVELKRYFTIPNEAGTFDSTGKVMVETVALTEAEAVARKLNWDEGRDVFETTA